MAESISSIGVGKDYTTLRNFEAGEQGSIASGDQTVGEVYGTAPDAALTTVNGWTVPAADTSARIIIRPATGEKHTGKAGTGATIEMTGVVALVTIDNAGSGINMTFEGLEIKCPSGGVADSVTLLNDNGFACDIIVDSSIVYGGVTGAKLTASTHAGTSFRVKNSVIYDHTRCVWGLGNDKLTAEYSTAFGSLRGFDACKSTNCIAMNNSNSDFFSSVAGSDYSISSDTSAPGTNNLQSKTTYTSYFTSVTAGSEDFSLLGTTDDGGIFGVTGLAGTPISGITTDILGNTRDATNPDIGAFEFGAAPPVTGIIPQIMHHRQLQRRR